MSGKNGESKEQTSSKSSIAKSQARKNIEAIMELEEKSIHSRSAAERMADKVTTISGSLPFIIIHIIWFSGWVLINVGLVPVIKPFDPFPFSFLTLVVSLEAIFLSLLVLMSQNRMIKESDKRTHIDLQLNMLAEQEGTLVLKIVQEIGKKLGVDIEEEEIQALEEKTDVQELAETVEKKLPG